MAESELTVVVAAETGATYTLTAADAQGSYFDNDGNTVLLVQNGVTASTNVTFTGQLACNYGVLHNTVVTVGISTNKVIGPFNTSHFNDASGHCHLTWSATTNVTAVSIRVPRVV